MSEDANEEDLTELCELPLYMRNHRYGPKGEKLLKICQELAKQSAPAPFFLSVRKAGEIIFLDYQDAAKFLKVFCLNGYLECVEQGRGTRASSYIFCHFETTKQKETNQ